MPLSLNNPVRVRVRCVLSHPLILIPHMAEKVIADPRDVVSLVGRFIDRYPDSDDINYVKHARWNHLENAFHAALLDSTIYRHLLKVRDHRALVEVEDM